MGGQASFIFPDLYRKFEKFRHSSELLTDQFQKNLPTFLDPFSSSSKSEKTLDNLKAWHLIAKQNLLEFFFELNEMYLIVHRSPSYFEEYPEEVKWLKQLMKQNPWQKDCDDIGEFLASI